MLALILALVAAVPGPVDEAQWKLRPGAGSTLCLQCHADFSARLQKKFVHTPVKKGACVQCHDPHASSHGKLLATEPDQVCKTCHDAVIPEQAKSVHQPVKDGTCTGCHDPHASAEKFQLVKAPAQLCASCHKPLVEAAASAKFKHKPVEKGCQTCHVAHASTKSDDILRAPQPQLCLECHKATPKFAKAHMNFPVTKTSCTSCHDPHGSSRKGMLYASAHQPVVAKQCTQCHLAPVAGQPVQVKKQGAALCKDCHAVRVAQMMDKARVHWPVADETGCLHCHDPHASKLPRLVSGSRQDASCRACHADTIARQDRSPTKHKPVNDGQCTACHDPHGSDNVLFMRTAGVTEGCGTCHDYQKHSTHPIGASLKDPRNKNLTLDCLSCHRAHGTEYKSMVPYPTTSDLCTKCHESFKR